MPGIAGVIPVTKALKVVEHFTRTGANESIAVQIVSGSAIVYGATVDNHTNDPSLQLAKTAP